MPSMISRITGRGTCSTCGKITDVVLAPGSAEDSQMVEDFRLSDHRVVAGGHFCLGSGTTPLMLLSAAK